MDRQLCLNVPMPILMEIVKNSSLKDRISFMRTCKLMFEFVRENLLPIYATTLYQPIKPTSGIFMMYGCLDPISNTIYFTYATSGILRLDLSTGVISEIKMEMIAEGLGIDPVKRILYCTVKFGIYRLFLDSSIREIKAEPWIIYDFNSPGCMHLSTNDMLYAVDDFAGSIVKIDTESGKLTHVCGKSKKTDVLADASLHGLFDLVVDHERDLIYASQPFLHVIRVIRLRERRVDVLCGTMSCSGYRDGIAKEALFTLPRGLALDKKSNLLYVADSWNCIVRVVDLNDGARVSTLCGVLKSGVSKDGSNPTFNRIDQLALDPSGDILYVFEAGLKVRQVRINRNT